jgi:hypothetical protein
MLKITGYSFLLLSCMIEWFVFLASACVCVADGVALETIRPRLVVMTIQHA